MPEKYELLQTIQATPKRLYEAWLDSKEHSQMTNKDASIKSTEDTTFTTINGRITGENIDVRKFPSPVWHENDGGRYIGTGTYSITRDPEDGWLNAGSYRAQVHGPKEVGFLTARGHHGYIHRQKYAARGEKMPVCMVLGGDPISFYFGGTEAPFGTFEIDMVGGIRGKPMQLVEGKVTGLPFPANAEIVLEGYVDPQESEMEGPFGEWTGHYAGGREPRTLLRIEAIYHRDDPILLGVPPMGQGPDELAIVFPSLAKFTQIFFIDVEPTDPMA